MRSAISLASTFDDHLDDVAARGRQTSPRAFKNLERGVCQASRRLPVGQGIGPARPVAWPFLRATTPAVVTAAP